MLHFCCINAVTWWRILLLFRWVQCVLLNSIHHHNAASFIHLWCIDLCCHTLKIMYRNWHNLLCHSGNTLDHTDSVGAKCRPVQCVFAHSCLISGYTAWYQRYQHGLWFFLPLLLNRLFSGFVTQHNDLLLIALNATVLPTEILCCKK